MSITTLLSATLGVPITLLALILLFSTEARVLAGRPRSAGLRAITLITCALFALVVVSRFVQYA